MGSGKSGLYSGTKGSSASQSKQHMEKNRQETEDKKQIEQRKLEAVRSLFENGSIQKDKIKKNPNCLKDITQEQWIQILEEQGYKEISKSDAAHSSSGAKLIKIGKQGKGHNINQIQFSPGGGRHDDSPYIKISTTDQKVIKVVFGKKSEYKHEGNEKATIIFTEE